MTEAFNLAVRANPNVAVTVAHEDGDLLVVEKAAGVVTQPGKGHAGDSLLNGVFAMREGGMGKLLHNLGVRRDFGLLHRLDKDTSGLLVIAKSPNAYDQLRRDFEARRVDKEYLAIVAGIPAPLQGVVQARLKEVEVPTGERFSSVKKVVISRQGQEAISAYKVLSQAGAGKLPASLVHVAIKTGRLHQIRAHMVFLNCQVLGDSMYAPAEISGAEGKVDAKKYPKAPRLCLHAGRLGFKHPTGGKWVHFESPLPGDLARYAGKLGLAVG